MISNGFLWVEQGGVRNAFTHPKSSNQFPPVDSLDFLVKIKIFEPG